MATVKQLSMGQKRQRECNEFKRRYRAMQDFLAQRVQAPYFLEIIELKRLEEQVNAVCFRRLPHKVTPVEFLLASF
jgi:hypothetical protein